MQKRSVQGTANRRATLVAILALSLGDFQTAARAKDPLVFLCGSTQDAEIDGIHVYRMNAQTGSMRHMNAGRGLQSPSYIAFHPTGKYLYAVGSSPQVAADSGAVAAFSLDHATGALELLNIQSSAGPVPCHLVVDAMGTAVLVANYAGGSVASLPLGLQGELGPAASVHRHVSDPPGSISARAHSVNLDPLSRFACAAELGLDQLRMYRFDSATATMTPHTPPYVSVAAGSGPRHGAFHPTGKFFYMINETNCTLDAFQYDTGTGTMRHLERVPTIPVPFQHGFSTAELLFHPSGKFLYGSNRGHDTIVIFAVDEDTGKLTVVGHESTRGKTPRNFGFDPTGTFLFAANQESDSVVQFRVDAATGKLSATGVVLVIHEPLCVKSLAN
ncbi:MAG: lactonase family protein [Planctomycetota bacterium]|nr:lactonase family protein [Planctomycetota bacterium]MDA1177556.1 lactonase family protein [Planctomycetota bacterium]